MSADTEIDPDVVTDEIPETGVRSRSQFARRIHRERSDTTEPIPACRSRHLDDNFKRCEPSRLLSFNRWTLCDNPECFGQHPRTDGGIDQYIRFARHHVQPLLTGEKTLTVRLEFERDLGVDDDVDLIDDQDERFATATIASVGEMTAVKFVELDPRGHRSYSSVSELAAHLRQYYPDADFWPGTRVHIVRLQNVQSVPEYEPPSAVQQPGEVNTGP